jgi:EAL domain-containing protein (putative c-di-GMP-specific phosphodiesterase class I)
MTDALDTDGIGSRSDSNIGTQSLLLKVGGIEPMLVATAITHLSHIMGVNRVAREMENKNQLELLKKIGVDYTQGFLIQHPERVTAQIIAAVSGR